MRRYAWSAPVGDEQKGEDPSVNQLQEMVARMLGKETPFSFPREPCATSSPSPPIAGRDVILLDRTAHPLISEAGGATVLAGVTLHPIDGPSGMFTPRQVAELILPPSRYRPPVRLVSIEQTVNAAAGASGH